MTMKCNSVEEGAARCPSARRLPNLSLVPAVVLAVPVLALSLIATSAFAIPSCGSCVAPPPGGGHPSVSGSCFACHAQPAPTPAPTAAPTPRPTSTPTATPTPRPAPQPGPQPAPKHKDDDDHHAKSKSSHDDHQYAKSEPKKSEPKKSEPKKSESKNKSKGGHH